MMDSQERKDFEQGHSVRMDLFQAFIASKGLNKDWRLMNRKEKAKFVFYLFTFNFILIYKFFRNEPVIKE